MTTPIIIRGTAYPDADTAAAAFGVQRRAILCAIRLGTLDRVGLPPHVTRFRHGPEPFPVRIRGTVYPNVNAAAEALGVSPITVRTAIKHGREDFIGLGKSRKHCRAAVGRIPGNSKMVQIGALVFASKRHLARFTGLGATTIRDHLRKGNTAILMAHVMRAQAQQEGHQKRLPGQVAPRSKRDSEEDCE